MKSHWKPLAVGLGSVIAITLFILLLPFGGPAAASGQAITPDAGPDFTGAVTTGSGAPVGNSRVSLFNSNYSIDQATYTSLNGTGSYSLTLNGVPNGTYQMKARAPMYGFGSIAADSRVVTVTYSAGTPQQVNFSLRAPAITGTVVMPAPPGGIVTGTNVSLYVNAGDPDKPSWQYYDNYLTNGSGVFRIPRIDNGSYRAVAKLPSRPGFEMLANSLPMEFQYTQGMTFSIGTLTLTTISISGTVTKPDATPQANNWVDLYLTDGNNPQGTSLGGVSTDSAGVFKFGGLSNGMYKLIARADPSSSYFDSEPAQVPFFGNQATPIILQLRTPNLTGAVVDPLGNPVQGSRVDLKTGQWGPPQDSRSTDATGQFAFAGLITGSSYVLTAWPPSGSPYGESADYLLMYTGTARITLTLTTADLAGVVHDPQGQAVANANIDLYTRDHTTQRFAFAGNDGTFRFGSLVTNTYLLRARPGPGSDYGDSRELEVIYRGTPITNVVLTVTLPFLTGTVTAPDQTTPVAWAGVSLHSKDYRFANWSGTDQNGRFRFGSVDDGLYIIEAMPPFGGDSPYSQSRSVPVTVTNGVAVNVTQPFTLPLTGASITGTVLSPDGRTPISMTHVMLHDSNWYVQSHSNTNESGSFSFGGIDPGDYLIEADAPPMSRYSRSLPKTVNVAANETHYYTVTLTSPSLTGLTVRDAGGILVPVPRAGVDVRLKDNPAVANFSGSNEAGEFSFGGLNDGVYVLSAHTPWEATGLVPPASKLITITAGQAISETIIFTKASKHVAGTVARSNGQPVTDAMVFANKEGGAGWANGTVDDQGRYTIDVSPGGWMVSVGPARPEQIPDWTYGRPPVRVEFADNSDPITKTVNFTVTNAGSLIMGRLLKPDGNPPTQAGVGFHSVSGFGNGGPVEQDGSFRVSLPPGTYMFDVWLPDTSLSSPRLDPIVLGEDETKQLGTLTLQGRNSLITGYVKDASGRGLADVEIGAWLRKGIGGPGGGPGDWSHTTTITDGVFSLYVVSGTWEVSAMPSPDSRYVQSGPPTRVDVGENTTVSDVNIVVSSADGELTGSVVDADGEPLNDIYGFANANVGEGPNFRGYGAPINGGTFTIRLPSGTYSVEGGMPPGSEYSISRITGVVVTSSTSIVLTATQARAWIAGSLVGAAGSGLQANVFAGGPQGHSFTQVDAETGRYSMRVAPGEWFVNAWVDPSTGYVLEMPRDNRIIATENLTTTFNFTVTSASSKIWGVVSKPNGDPVGGAWVGAMQRDASGNPRPPYGGETNPSGVYTITVPNGTYEVNTFMPPDAGYLPPAPVTATVSSGTPVVRRDLQFRQPGASIYGTVTLSGTAVSDGLVRAFSDGGARAYTEIRSDGTYSMPVTGDDTWHIQAVREYSSTLYQSQVYSVPVGSGATQQDLVLAGGGTSMPNSSSTSFDASAMRQITLGDGTQIIIPAGSLAVSGTVTVNAVPKGNVAMDGSARPIGLAYDLSALDSNNAAISRFRQNVSVVLQYTEEQLAALGITEDQVMGSYWDSATGSWRNMTNVVQDKTANTLTIYTDHFSQWTITGGSAGTAGTAPDLGTSTKAASPSSNLQASDTVTYTVIMANSGDADASAVLTDSLPSEVTYVSGSVSPSPAATFHQGTGQIRWSGTISASQSVTVTFRVTLNLGVTAGSVITNTAVINDGTGTLTSPWATIAVAGAATATPTPTATSSPTATPSPTPTPTSTATATATATQTATATASPTPTATAVDTATATATATTTETATATASPTATATASPTPTATTPPYSVYLPVVLRGYASGW
ncbi:MAG: carboxypeptidase regulatory-like domain-containing protein [Chloroflexi bacterium]|nr:carboxypeptidase regulatory-like domain-containing protein [Chloroflexota bacterium]